MGHYGQCWGAGLGDPQNHIIYQKATATPDGTSVLVEFTPRTSLGNSWWGIYINAKHVRTVWAKEGLVTKARCSLPWGELGQWSVILLHHGALADPTYASRLAVRIIESAEGKRTCLTWDWPSETLGDIDDELSYLSNWSLSGVDPFKNVLPVSGKFTWGKVRATLTVTAGTAAITLKINDSEVASGSGAVGTTVTLTQSNSSQLSGTVAVAAGAVTDTDGADVYVRFPESALILRDTTNPPSTQVASVPFRGVLEARWTEPAELTPTTYYYAIKMRSDTNVNGSQSATETITLQAHPSGPSGFSGFSGTKNSFKLGVLPSPTPGCSYALYTGDINNVMDLITPSYQVLTNQTAAFTMGPIGFTGFSGYATALVQGFSGGLRSNNGDVLRLEFNQFSAWIPPRPNKAGIASWDATNLALTVQCTQNILNETLAATNVLLFVRAANTTAFDYTTASATAVLGTEYNSVKRTTLSYTAPSAGLYIITVLAQASDGTRSAIEEAPEVVVYVSAGTPGAITGFSATVNRG